MKIGLVNAVQQKLPIKNLIRFFRFPVFSLLAHPAALGLFISMLRQYYPM